MSEKAQAGIAAVAEAKQQQAAGLRKVASWISLQTHRDILLAQAEELEGEATRLNDKAAISRQGSAQND